MYRPRKLNAITEQMAIDIVGKKAVNDVLAINCEPTNRVIDDCFDVVEMSATIETLDNDGDVCRLTVLYLVDKTAFCETDDLGNLDYSDYTFIID